MTNEEINLIQSLDGQTCLYASLWLNPVNSPCTNLSCLSVNVALLPFPFAICHLPFYVGTSVITPLFPQFGHWLSSPSTSFVISMYFSPHLPHVTLINDIYRFSVSPFRYCYSTHSWEITGSPPLLPHMICNMPTFRAFNLYQAYSTEHIRPYR